MKAFLKLLFFPITVPYYLFKYLFDKTTPEKAQVIKNRKLAEQKEKSATKEKLNELNSRRASRSFNVAGVTFENRQAVIGTIVRRYGYEGLNNIELIPEPTNSHDKNAIKVIFKDIGQIGYISKDKNIGIKKYIDNNMYDIKWNIDSYDGDYDDYTYYMEIRLYTTKE